MDEVQKPQSLIQFLYWIYSKGREVDQETQMSEMSFKLWFVQKGCNVDASDILHSLG